MTNLLRKKYLPYNLFIRICFFLSQDGLVYRRAERTNPIIIIIHSLELFTSALADGFSLESEWQQVSTSLQDYSKYSGRPQ